ncbi:DinB family protein [Soonwooa sp.]|uniref:DinB family protein n=1 Tax=Soonwooa sp. TaxID=1938592 RepID=UPI0026243FC2|nr:DinB family protein [Soonwooa sp.]
MTATAQVLSKEQLLKHWQGHRNLTRRVIEAFPEKDLLEFSIGGMRPFSKMAVEMISIGSQALKGILNDKMDAYNEDAFQPKTKQELLDRWDEETVLINDYYNQIPAERFEENFNLFGEYKFPVYENILYFVDNEIHHRGQAYVYLRALGIEPPFFWER